MTSEIQIPSKYLIVGLGNPGKGYKGTYHNAGREVAEQYAVRHQVAFRSGAKHQYAEFDYGCIILPEAYMNLSGDVVRPFAKMRNYPPESILVLVDDVYIGAGAIKIRQGGATAGHNGLKSIEAALGTKEYPRIRIGVGPDPGGAGRSDYVLSRPSRAAAADFFEGKEKAVAAIDVVIDQGIDQAMNMFN